MSTTYTQGPAHNEPDGAFKDACTLNDGRVLFAPSNSSSIGVFDPQDDSYNQVFTNTYLDSVEDKYSDATLTDDGRVVFTPEDAPSIGIYDPSNGSFTRGDSHGHSGSGFFEGATKLSNGKIIMAPYGATEVGIFDPSGSGEGDYISGPSLPTSEFDKYIGAAVAGNGNVIFAPYGETKIGIYNPSNDSFSLGPDTSGQNQGGRAYRGAVAADDGRVFFINRYADNAGVYDPSDGSFTQGPSLETISYNRGVKAPSGNIITAPKSTEIALIDPTGSGEGETKLLSATSSNDIFVGGAVDGNGRIIFAPNYSDYVGILSGDFTTGNPPTASLNVTDNFNCNVSVDASNSSDPDGKSLTFKYDWGDGTVDNNAGSTASHTYSSSGTYTIKLTVNSSDGESDSTQQNVETDTKFTVNDGGTIKRPGSIYVNDSGSIKKVQELYVNDAGTIKQVFPDPIILSESFEDQSLSEWTGKSSVITTTNSEAYNGSYSAQVDRTDPDKADVIDHAFYNLKNATQISFFEFYYYETRDSAGSGMRLWNSNGNEEVGAGTSNPWWEFTDGTGDDTIYQNAPYNAWHKVTLTFDWANNQFDYNWKTISDGYTETGTRSLSHGVDVKQVSMSNYQGYSGNTWGPSPIQAWWDDITIKR